LAFFRINFISDEEEEQEQEIDKRGKKRWKLNSRDTTERWQVDPQNYERIVREDGHFMLLEKEDFMYYKATTYKDRHIWYCSS
jgi:hypothetical protein